jgi:hypothetical protein
MIVFVLRLCEPSSKLAGIKFGPFEKNIVTEVANKSI